MLAEAVREGLITPPTLPTADLRPRKPIMTFEELMRELEQDRADRDLSG